MLSHISVRGMLYFGDIASVKSFVKITAFFPCFHLFAYTVYAHQKRLNARHARFRVPHIETRWRCFV
jgi:hypothetical protein